MKLSEYIKVCDYEILNLSVYYKDEEYSNEGDFTKDYALDHYGNYEVVEIYHISKLEKVRTKDNDFIDALVVKPRLWIRGNENG